uniref:Protein kinase domain-containing protein n=1 Tax=Arcella intermedia TaxID=1963864 RepID=A0A6B2LBM3_9EUKA
MTNFELAIKIIKQGDKSLQEALDKEIKILKKCRSENVVAYYGSVSRENDTWILMDYCGVGSVKDVMKVVMEALSETQCKYVLHHTLKGLVYMHAQGILHLDVKAANILLTETGVVKLADFGVSQVLKSSEMTKGQDDYVGSPLFMAPEIIKKLGYNSKADIWSLGITIIEMMEIRPPNNDIVNIEMLPQLAERPPPTFKNSTGASPEFRAFLASLFVKDPVTRPSAIDLLTNPLMQNVTGSDCLTSMIYECQSLQMSKRKKFTPSMLL